MTFGALHMIATAIITHVAVYPLCHVRQFEKISGGRKTLAAVPVLFAGPMMLNLFLAL